MIAWDRASACSFDFGVASLAFGRAQVDGGLGSGSAQEIPGPAVKADQGLDFCAELTIVTAGIVQVLDDLFRRIELNRLLKDRL